MVVGDCAGRKRPSSTSPPRPQPQCLANARLRAPANAEATSTGSSMKMVSPAALASTTIGKAEALADPAVSAPGVCEVGAGDLFEAGAGGPEPDARLPGRTCVYVGTAVCRCHSAFSTAFLCLAPVRCPLSIDTAFLQRLQNQISYPW